MLFVTFFVVIISFECWTPAENCVQHFQGWCWDMLLAWVLAGGYIFLCSTDDADFMIQVLSLMFWADAYMRSRLHSDSTLVFVFRNDNGLNPDSSPDLLKKNKFAGWPKISSKLIVYYSEWLVSKFKRRLFYNFIGYSPLTINPQFFIKTGTLNSPYELTKHQN